ncbi:MAG TPA: CocE/NonD family hydrolase [Bryobacteraceae bacterium]|nr:CocE/NonD family hydrolase [Bryobacteraceae bacterium]
MRNLCLTLAWAAALSLPLKAATKPEIKQLHVPVRMRDGVHLYANIFLPGDKAKMPAILVRTPYGKWETLLPNYQGLLDHGYAIVVQDVRGRYESEGTFQPFTQEPADGDDTINWIARQPWSDGKVGMSGGSYLGIVQWKAALLNNPHLKALFPVVSGYDDYRDRFYSTGGAFKLGNRLEWMSENLHVPGYHPDFSQYVLHLPLRTADFAATGRESDMYQQALAHPAFDSFWHGISVKEHLDRVRVPAFAVGGWYDNYAQSDLEAFAALRKNSGLNRILIGPWPHNMSILFEGVDFGPESKVPIGALMIEWFDQWLMGKDTPLVSQPPVKIFVMGADRWRDAGAWPPEQARARDFYLESAGNANSLSGGGALDESASRTGSRRDIADRFVFDPRDPVPTRGGSVCCNPRVFPWGPMDQRPVEQRPDVLVYTTHPLRQDVEAVGPVKAVLYVSTTARDTDFTAKLVDVFPDGTARNLTDGILRLRYRNSLEHAEMAVPGQVYQITVDAGVTGNVFLRGHRIRLEISSSNFPRFDRNPNTGTPVANETKPTKATQTVYHDQQRPSRLVLMVMGS